MTNSLSPQTKEDRQLKNAAPEEMSAMIAALDLPKKFTAISNMLSPLQDVVEQRNSAMKTIMDSIPNIEAEAFSAFQGLSKQLARFTATNPIGEIVQKQQEMQEALKTALSTDAIHAFAQTLQISINRRTAFIKDSSVVDASTNLVKKTDSSVTVDFSSKSIVVERSVTVEDFIRLENAVIAVEKKQDTTSENITELLEESKVMKEYLFTLKKAIPMVRMVCKRCNKIMAKVELMWIGKHPCPTCKRYLDVPSADVDLQPIKSEQE